MGNMTANQRLASHIKACEQKMSCVYARTAAEAKQIERRVAAGSLEAVMPGLYARPDYWSELKFRQRYLHRVRALAQKHPDWTFCSYTAAVICIGYGPLRKSIPTGRFAPIRRLLSMAFRFRMPI